MRDDALDLIGGVTEFFQRGLDRLIDNLQHAAAGEQLVFHQRNVRLDTRRVAIHQETDGARGASTVTCALRYPWRFPTSAASSQVLAASSFKCANSFESGIWCTAQRCSSITSNIGATLSFATGFATPLARESR